jgi:hypothetical protein
MGCICIARKTSAEPSPGVVRLPPVISQATFSSPVTPASPLPVATGPPPFTDEGLAWRKGEYLIVPYGIGWLNTAYETSRTVTGAFVLFVLPGDVQGDPSFIVNARATRLGFDVTGPMILGAETAGRIEFDFHGQAETENRTGVLLRHAYGEFKTPTSRFVAGQTWDVISPLLPTTVNYGVGWAAGNIGYRRAQVRGSSPVQTTSA